MTELALRDDSDVLPSTLSESSIAPSWFFAANRSDAGVPIRCWLLLPFF